MNPHTPPDAELYAPASKGGFLNYIRQVKRELAALRKEKLDYELESSLPVDGLHATPCSKQLSPNCLQYEWRSRYTSNAVCDACRPFIRYDQQSD